MCKINTYVGANFFAKIWHDLFNVKNDIILILIFRLCVGILVYVVGRGGIGVIIGSCCCWGCRSWEKSGGWSLFLWGWRNHDWVDVLNLLRLYRDDLNWLSLIKLRILVRLQILHLGTLKLGIWLESLRILDWLGCHAVPDHDRNSLLLLLWTDDGIDSAHGNVGDSFENWRQDDRDAVQGLLSTFANTSSRFDATILSGLLHTKRLPWFFNARIRKFANYVCKCYLVLN